MHFFCPFCVFDSRSFYLQRTGVCVYVFDSAKLIYRFYCYFCIILCSLAFAPSASSFPPNNHLVRVRANVQCYFGLLSFIVIAFWCFIWLFIIWNGWCICVCVYVCMCWLTSLLLFSRGIIDLNCGLCFSSFIFCVSVASLFYGKHSFFSVFSQINFILGYYVY